MTDTLKIIHILCACLFLGNVIVSGTWAALADRTRDLAIIRFSNRLVLITDVLFTAGGSIGVVLTGYLMSGRWGGEAAQPWIRWSYLLFGLSGLIWLFVLLPIQLRQRNVLRESLTITSQYLRLSRQWQIWGAFATILPLPILYLMITKAG
jgi:uncharacterized membrane protein